MTKDMFPCTHRFFENYHKLYKPLEDRYYNSIEHLNKADVKRAFGLTKCIDQALRCSFYFDTLEFNDVDTVMNMRRCDIFNMFKMKE